MVIQKFIYEINIKMLSKILKQMLYLGKLL